MNQLTVSPPARNQFVSTKKSHHQNPQLGSKKFPALKITILCITTFFLFLVIILNVAISQQLFRSGMNFIFKYQGSTSSNFVKVIQNLISIVSSTAIVYQIGLFYMFTHRKLLAIIHIGSYFFFIYIIGILNAAFLEPRPFWYDSRIWNADWTCPLTFGQPSGHTFSIVYLFQPIVSDAIGYLKFHLLAVPLLFFWIVMPFTRLYLGVHGVNQVLFAQTLGFIFLILFKYIYQKQLFKLFWSLLHNKKSVFKIMFIVFVHSAIIIIPLILYLYNFVHRPVDPKYLARIKQQCNIQSTNASLQSNILTSCGIGCIGIGFLYGILLLKNKKQYRRYLLGKWHYRKKYMWFVHLIILGICGLLPLGIFVFIADYGVKVEDSVVKFILYCFGGTLGGIGITSTSVMLNVKWKVMQKQQSSIKRKNMVTNQQIQMQIRDA